MKIKFDKDQQFQLDAVRAVVDLFGGQPLAHGAWETRTRAPAGELLSELGRGNRLGTSDAEIWSNLLMVQQRNGINAPPTAKGDRNFTVEMETGTGKTYVYLRTLHELHRVYGWKKFIIVVPSVAIREGVLESIRLTREHFADLYGNQPLDAWVYDSSYVSRLRQFAAGNGMQLLVITIDAFNKQDVAVIHRRHDRLSGRRPIEFIQQTNPVVVLDEPQNMETPTAREAIRSLHPLFTLRYSATHRNLYNLVYRLDPGAAYDLKLVKRVEVDSVLDDADFNQPYLRVERIRAGKSKLVAELEIDARGRGGLRRKMISVTSSGADLRELSGGREAYEGFVVDRIDAGRGYVAFTNAVRLGAGEAHGDHADERMRVQIRETIREHLEKERQIRELPAGERIKVLSLFFIDRVANYADEDGKIRRWFEEEYRTLAGHERYRGLNPLAVEQVHDGYFARDRKGNPKDSREGRDTRADSEAYEIIMRDKERLLAMEEPLRFVFSHSALREGWDNPNVFQICTLNETRSQMRKRQEIGRGLRLPVRENGERCLDTHINRLTVIANESYEKFARQLQTEIKEECGVSFEGRIHRKRERHSAILKRGWDRDRDFRELWKRISRKTRYKVAFESEALIRAAVGALERLPAVRPAGFRLERGELLPPGASSATGARTTSSVAVEDHQHPIPDLLGYLQRETELTRGTLAEILIRSGRLDEVRQNPQQFLDRSLVAIRSALHAAVVDGVEYERASGEYPMRLFEEHPVTDYADRMLEVRKSIHDTVQTDSEAERELAEWLDVHDDVCLFLKLPRWYRVPTPAGDYHPGWAIVVADECSRSRFLVRDISAAHAGREMREEERLQICCAEAHFRALGVEYDRERAANGPL